MLLLGSDVKIVSTSQYKYWFCNLLIFSHFKNPKVYERRTLISTKI